MIILLCLGFIGFLIWTFLKRRIRPPEVRPALPPKSLSLLNYVEDTYNIEPSERRYLYSIVNANGETLTLHDTLRALIQCPISSETIFTLARALIQCSPNASERYLLAQRLYTISEDPTSSTPLKYNIVRYLASIGYPFPSRQPPMRGRRYRSEIPRNEPVIQRERSPPPTRAQNEAVFDPILNLERGDFEVVEVQGLLPYVQQFEPPRERRTAEQLMRFVEEQRRLLDLYRTQHQNTRRTRTIYEHKENVHDSFINKSILKTARALIQKYGVALPVDFSFEEIYSKCPSDSARDKVTRAVEKINSIKGMFGTEPEPRFTLQEALHAVITFIWTRTPDMRDTMLRTLADDLYLKSSKCTTGLLTALVNSIQGYQDEYKLDIGISNEIYGKVSFYLKGKLQTAPEEVLDSLGSDKVKFIEYLKTIQPELLNGLLKDYRGVCGETEIRENLSRSLNTYAQVKGVF